MWQNLMNKWYGWPQWSPPLNGGSMFLFYAGRGAARLPQWSPPLNGGSIRLSDAVRDRTQPAAMEPAAERREHARAQRAGSARVLAAMEPAAERREHSSQNPGRLICANGSLCERCKSAALRTALDGLVKVQNGGRPACERSLWLYPPPQRSRSDNDSIGRWQRAVAMPAGYRREHSQPDPIMGFDYAGLQWSPPLGGEHTDHVQPSPPICLPQWSPPRSGGST